MDEHSDERTCPICLEDFEGQYSLFCSCPHIFCTGCVRSWFEKLVNQEQIPFSCPVCQVTVKNWIVSSSPLDHLSPEKNALITERLNDSESESFRESTLEFMDIFYKENKAAWEFIEGLNQFNEGQNQCNDLLEDLQYLIYENESSDDAEFKSELEAKHAGLKELHEEFRSLGEEAFRFDGFGSDDETERMRKLVESVFKSPFPDTRDLEENFIKENIDEWWKVITTFTTLFSSIKVEYEQNQSKLSEYESYIAEIKDRDQL